MDRRPALGPLDQEALDALIDANFDPESLDDLGSDARARAARAAELLALLNDYPVDDADDTLVHATLACIDRHEATSAAALSFEAAREAASSRRRIRLPDFISVAAVLLIAASILLPVIHQTRGFSVDRNCNENLRKAAFAVSQYAGDYEGAMPMAMAGFGGFGSGGWDEGDNRAHLDPLVEYGYCEAGHLCCPGHSDEDQAGYSYQWQVAGTRKTWGAGPGVSLAIGDRNPLVDAFRQGRLDLSPLTMTPSHGGRGQNVLATDGSIIWLQDPIMPGRDNIWLPNGTTQLVPGFRPRGDDAFLVQ